MAIVAPLSGAHIAHAELGLRFLNSAAPELQGFDVSAETLDELIDARPTHVFEIGHRWQVVPAKLFRYEDRLSYLRGLYPGLQEEQVGVLQLPTLDAFGVFDRHDAIPDELFSGNHVAELFLAASMRLSGKFPEHAIAFFIDDKVWLLLSRAGRIVFVQAHRIVSDTDAVFYVAAHLQHFGLLRETTTLFVGGRISALGSLHRQLSIYFEVVDLAEALPSYAQKGALDPIDTAVSLLLAYQWGLRSLTLAV